MCSRHDVVQLEPPEGGSAAEPTLGGLCQLVRIVVRGTLPRRSTRTILTFPRSSCFAVPKPRIVALGCANRGIELRRPPLPSSSICAKRIRAIRIVHGTRVRDCDSFRAFGVWSRLFDSERARPAPRPAATARWQVDW